MALSDEQKRIIAIASARKRQAEASQGISQVDNLDYSGISPYAQGILKSGRSETPEAERLSLFRQNLAKGMPEQVALEQAVFAPQTFKSVVSEGAEFASGVPGAIPTLVSGAVAEPIAGVSGLVQSANPFVDPGAGARAVEGVREALTIDPIGERARKSLGVVGKAFEPLPQLAEKAGEAVLEKTDSPAVATAVQTAVVAIPELIAARLGAKGTQNLTSNLQELSSTQKANLGFKSNDLSMGAAETPKALEREVISSDLPVPFEEESALTKGQVTRNFEQLQFEKEAAKIGDTGEPLRERMENQSEVLVRNLDALAEMSEPRYSELRDLGKSVDEALVNRQRRLKRRVDKLYDEAREAGEMRQPVDMNTVPEMLEDIQRYEGVAPNSKAIRQEALRLGIVDENLNPQSVSLEDAELFRSFVNDATDITNPQQARIRRIAVSAVDEATENSGGDVFKKARRARAEMARELENSGLAKRLLSTKRGTDERSVAFEDVFKKVILDSPKEEMNKLRGSLLKSGPEGKQAWSDLKAKGVNYIKERAQSLSQRDSRGNPVLSPDKLNRAIKSMDDQGKLDSLYGKKGAQILRDLGSLANDIYTAPPGAVNFSNTASALQVALDSLAGFAVTGIPAPVATTLTEAAKYVKSSKKKKQIRESLNYLKNKNP